MVSFESRQTTGPDAPVAPARRAAANALYPAIRPYQKGFLRVSPLHEIYYEQSGNLKVSPRCFCTVGLARHRSGNAAILRPQRYRIVLFDQRGCGASRPHASCGRNHLGSGQ